MTLKTIKRTRSHNTRRRHKRGGETLRGLRTYGFAWDRQSCWMDTSLMSLFYPDKMHSIIYPYIQKAGQHKDMHDIVPPLMQAIDELRTPGVTPSLHGIRSLFAKHYAQRRRASQDQRDAFQVENELGYVFYFVQELLHVMGVPPIHMVSRTKGDYQDQWVLEIEHCDDSTPLEACLQKNYAEWKIRRRAMKYMIIEMVGDSVKAQEHVSFNGRQWELQSMIVFDCSHFIAYLKQDGQWYLYDDTRSLSHTALEPYEFGQVYRKGGCRFQYGKENTFFFYAPA